MQREDIHLGRIVAHMYPNIARHGLVEQDYTGKIVLNWDTKFGPKPTETELDAAWLELLKINKEKEFASAATKELHETFPEAGDNKELLVLYVSTTANGDARMNTIRTLRNKLESKKQQVRGATNPSMISSVVWS